MLCMVKPGPQDIVPMRSPRFKRRTAHRPASDRGEAQPGPWRDDTDGHRAAGKSLPGRLEGVSSPAIVRVGQYKPNLRIAELRKARGMTQAELAEKAKLGRAGRAQIARFETRSRTPTWDTLVKIAVALGCKTINELFGRMPVSRPSSPTKPRRPKD